MEKVHCETCHKNTQYFKKALFWSIVWIGGGVASSFGRTMYSVAHSKSVTMMKEQNKEYKEFYQKELDEIHEALVDHHETLQNLLDITSDIKEAQDLCSNILTILIENKKCLKDYPIDKENDE